MVRTIRRRESPWMRRDVDVTAESRVLRTRSSTESSASKWQLQEASMS